MSKPVVRLVIDGVLGSSRRRPVHWPSGFSARTLVAIVLLFGLLAGVPASVRAQEAIPNKRENRSEQFLRLAFSITRTGISDPILMPDGERFWYATGMPDSTIIRVVDPRSSTDTPLFEVDRLRQALEPLLKLEPGYWGLPFDTFDFEAGDEGRVTFAVDERRYLLSLDDYAVGPAPRDLVERMERRKPRVVRKGLFAHSAPIREVVSPDGRWLAGIQAGDLWIRSATSPDSVRITEVGPG